MTRLIDADAIHYSPCNRTCDRGIENCQKCKHAVVYRQFIDNAPTVENPCNDCIEKVLDAVCKFKKTELLKMDLASGCFDTHTLCCNPKCAGECMHQCLKEV